MPPTPASMLRTKRSWPGDIDEAETQRVAAGRGKFEVREADVDGDAAALFFFEPVGIDAGQGFDQRGLAVIDVPGGADDDGFHGGNSIRKSLA